MSCYVFLGFSNSEKFIRYSGETGQDSYFWSGCVSTIDWKEYLVNGLMLSLLCLLEPVDSTRSFRRYRLRRRAPDLSHLRHIDGSDLRILRSLRNWSRDSYSGRQQRVPGYKCHVFAFSTWSVPSFKSLTLPSASTSASYCKYLLTEPLLVSKFCLAQLFIISVWYQLL